MALRIATNGAYGEAMRARRLGIGVAVMSLVMASAACSSSSTKSKTTAVTTPQRTTVPIAATSTAVWPWATSSLRYATPRAAAEGFARDFLHMASPVVGAFSQGDSRSGEVEIQADASGPVTTVFVRQLTADSSWWVLGSVAAHITITSPSLAAVISSPVALAGSSLAFEGTVQTQVREDDVVKPLGQGYVTGGSTSMGPFTGSLTFASPTAIRGAVVLLSISAKDGSVLEASVLRVGLRAPSG